MVTHLLEVSLISSFLAGFIETVIPPRESRNMRKKPSAGGSSFIRAAETFRPEAPQTLELFPSCARHREESGDLWKETEK